MYYSDDKSVTKLMQPGFLPNRVEWIFNYLEVQERFSESIKFFEWSLEALQFILNIKGNITYALTVSTKDFQAVHLDKDDFVILIDHRVYYKIILFCLRLQSLPPLAEFINVQEVEEKRNFSGKYLLDITTEIVNTTDFKIFKGPLNQALLQAITYFILAHEIAHIAHGHFEFIQSKDYKENFANTEENESLTDKTLEMDADSSATTSVVEIFERYNLAYMDNFESPNDENAIKYKENTRKKYILGIYLAHIFRDTISIKYSSKHPGSYARFLTSAGILKICFTNNYPEALPLVDLAREKLVECFTNLSGSIEGLGHPIAANLIVDDGGEEQFFYNELGERLFMLELEPLYGRWSSIRPYLEKYRRGGDLAPAIAKPI